MQKRSSKYSFACAVTQVNEGTTGDVKGIVPALWVLVLVTFLDPGKYLAERFEFQLAIRQVDVL